MKSSQPIGYYQIRVDASQFITDVNAGKDVTEHLQNGADPFERWMGYTPLHIALIKNHSKTLNSLMNHEGLDYREAFAKQDANGCSPLGAAIDENIRLHAEQKRDIRDLKYMLGAEFKALRALPADIKTEAVNRDNIMGVFAMCDVKDGIDAVFSDLSIQQKKEVMHTVHTRGNSAALLGHTPLMIASEFDSHKAIKQYKQVYKDIIANEGIVFESQKDISRSLLIAAYNGLENTTGELLGFFETKRGTSSPLNEFDFERNNIFHAALANHRNGISKPANVRRKIVGKILDKVKDRDLIDAKNNQGYDAVGYARSMNLTDIAEDIEAKLKQLKKAEQNRKKKAKRKAKKEFASNEEVKDNSIEIIEESNAFEELSIEQQTLKSSESFSESNPSEKKELDVEVKSEASCIESYKSEKSEESEKTKSIVPDGGDKGDRYELFKDFVDSVVNGNNLNEIARKKDAINFTLGKEREEFDRFISRPSNIEGKSIKELSVDAINERDIFKNEKGKLSNKSNKILYYIAPELKKVKTKTQKTPILDKVNEDLAAKKEGDEVSTKSNKPVPSSIIGLEVGVENSGSEAYSTVTHSSHTNQRPVEETKSDSSQKNSTIVESKSESVTGEGEAEHVSTSTTLQDDIISQQQRSLQYQNNVIALQNQAVGNLSSQVQGLSQDNQALMQQVQLLSRQNQSMNAALLQNQGASFQQRFDREGTFSPSNIAQVEQIKKYERNMAQNAINNGSNFAGRYYSVQDGMFISNQPQVDNKSR